MHGTRALALIVLSFKFVTYCNVCVITSFMCMYVTQTFRHGFPHQPTCLDYDPVQQLLAIGAQNGRVVLYPYTVAMEIPQ